MKMPKEYILVFIAGLFLLAYLLEAVVDPLTLNLTTPYQFFTSSLITKYPFTTAIITIRTFGIFMLPLWLFSFLRNYYQLKAATLFIGSVLLELYSVQQIVADRKVIALEWALAFAAAGIILMVPTILYLIRGLFGIKASKPAQYHGSLVDDDDDEY